MLRLRFGGTLKEQYGGLVEAAAESVDIAVV